jgi:hypothetical protein
MPQPKKPAEKRQRRNHADVGIVVREGRRVLCRRLIRGGVRGRWSGG